MYMVRGYTGLCLSIVVFLHADIVRSASAGDLMVAPTGVIFKGRERAAEVTLVNQSETESTYRLYLQDLRAKPDGSYDELAESESLPNTAKDMIRFSPRQVTLKPRETQKIRLMARKPAELREGEYRTHLFFRVVPPPDVGQYNVEQTEQSGKLVVKLVPAFGVSIPVIVQHGNFAAARAIKNFFISPDWKTVGIDVQRSGPTSVFGDIFVQYAPPEGGQAVTLAELRGIKVLYPLESRHVSLPLVIPQSGLKSGGRISIQYRAPKEEGERVLTEQTVNVP